MNLYTALYISPLSLKRSVSTLIASSKWLKWKWVQHLDVVEQLNSGHVL